MSSTVPPKSLRAFRAPRAKIERATVHIHALEAAIAALDENSFDQIQVALYAPDGDSGPKHPDGRPKTLDGLTLQAWAQAPAQISAIVGDALHNLRSALDLLACDLVALNNQKIDGVYFPFCANASEVEEIIRRREMTRAAPEVIELLRNLVIYPAAILSLRTLHDLNVMDKHTSLIDCICLMPESTFTGNSTSIEFVFVAVFHQLGQELGFLEGREVAATLKELSEIASGTLQAFASLYEP